MSRGDTRLVSWIIFQGHSSNEANILNIYPKQGLELNHLFQNEGKFRLAAYNKDIHTKDDFQGSSELKHVDVEVKFNQLEGTKLMPKNAGNFLAGDIFRKDFPAVFEAKFLINPISQEEISRLHFMLEDGSGNTLDEGTQALNVFTFIPRNSNAKYKIKASYTNELGAVSSQTFVGTSKALSIKDITHNEQVVRPGTPMSFSVAKTQFGGVSNDSDLPEQGNIKWNLDKVLIGTGRTINISGHQLMQKKKYHIEAYVTSAIGKTTGDNEDGVENDWHFEVKENIVEKIKIVKKPKAGLVGEFEIEKMTLNYDPQKDGAIKWNVVGASTGRGTESGLKFSYKFNASGSHTISCTIGGRACKEPITIEVVQASINVDTGKWIDNDGGSGNVLTKAGYDQEVNAYVLFKGLDGEEVIFKVYDDDTGIDDPIYAQTATLKENSSGVYWPLKLTKKPTTEFDGTSIQEKIEKKGLTKPGELYFQLIPTNTDLNTENVGKDLGRILNVIAEPEIVNAYFCDANNTEQLFSCSLEGALYFKVYALNMVGRKIEITLITESDAYWTWDDKLKITKWEDIQNKFKKEKIRDTKTGTFNEKGEVLVPVDLSKMGKPKNFIRLNAMVKILPDENVEEKQEERGFYMQHTNLAILFPGATLPTMVENKGAVKVGREGISGGKKEESKCPRCEAKITIEEFKQIFPDVLKVFDKGINNLKSTTLSQFIDSLNNTLVEFKINTCIKKTFFLSQIAKETGFFSRIDENLDYRTESALHTFWTKESHPNLYSDPSAYFKNPEKLANYVYRNVAENGNETSGDGYKYRGRGLIQITRKKGYRRFSEYTKNPSILSSPDLLLEDLNLMTRSAGWYWKHGVLLKNGSGNDINDVAQTGDFTETTRLVHGGTKDIKDRTNILNKIKPVLKTDECTIGKTDNKPETLSDADIEYHIYYNGGEIHYKIHNAKREIAEYFYHDIKGNIHKLGKIKLKKITDKYGGSYKDKLQDKSHVYLADIRDIKSYSKDGIVFQLAMNTGKHSRYYLNDVTIASLIGAILDLSLPDFTFNGFSDSEGRSVGGSNSHKNGMNGDLRYLRKDKSGKNVHLTLTSETGDPCGWKGMDETRQNKFNDALYKYGWKSMLSWKFDNGRLLHHSTQYDNHYHHLHVQSYKPTLKEIK
ncbi:MAG: hypothetical protein J6O88_00485 [Chryseobacterium sp.]|uniref:glycoside hydrolase family 19 protein n=1 Tax=Chryseobacterium sp. TaxID=1871047 RepID=UPI001B18726A|nr:hypothetical protein [Chryseobacterium sp.]MBO6183154.1 hypothetical protein [Chryseobacterium sp.]